MIIPGAASLRSTFRSALQIEAGCDFVSIRAAAETVREWLGERGVGERDAASWELVLAEAGNNAVEHTTVVGREKPVRMEVSCSDRVVEARVTDHGPGFDLPDEVALPDLESEGGRGLFLIQSLTDRCEYFRGKTGNVLVVSRARSDGDMVGPGPTEEMLRQRLAEAERALSDMTEELSSNYESLVAVFRYSGELGMSTNLLDFSQRILRDLMTLTGADGLVFRMAGSEHGTLETFLSLPTGGLWGGETVSMANISSSIEAHAASCCEDVWFGVERPLGGRDPLANRGELMTGLCHPFFVAGQLIGTVTLGYTAKDPKLTAAKVNLLHTFVDFLGIHIVNARLLDERTRARVMHRELEIAANIQQSLLPSHVSVPLPFSVAGTSRSARHVGGDLYDIVPSGSEGVLLVVADVMGKGVPAALLAAVFRTAVRSMPQLHNTPGTLLTRLNRVLHEDFSRVDMFATAKVVYLDFAKRSLISASAGHCPLIVCGAGGERMASLDESGLPLGIELDVEYPETRQELRRGGAVLIYTDGLIEARNPAGEMYGEDKLAWTFQDVLRSTTAAEQAGDELLSRLEDYCGDSAASDDRTLIILRQT